MNYSNISIQSVKVIDSSTDKVAILFVENSKLDSYDFSSILKQKIKEEKENKLWTLWEENKKYIVFSPKREAEDLRKLGATIYNQLKNDKEKIAFFEDLGNLKKEQVYALIEGMLLGSYDFDKYLTDKKSYPIQIQLTEHQISSEDFNELTILSEATALTKTLVNEPPFYMNAIQFSKEVEKAGEKYGFRTEILNKEQITSLGMGGLLAVNKGSEVPPTFSIMHYKPENAVNQKPLVLVGKGVTFDTGGYSIKTGGHMSTMKSDMGGGASVLGTLSAVAGNKLPYYVIGIVPATDNKINSDALVVDDIITTMDKTTVEVQNTDAEGRLILCDGLSYAKKFNPELVIDIATLTGASAAVTGPFGIAALSNNQEKFDQLKEIGLKVYERLLQLPLWEEYQDLLKSDVADLKNIGGPIGGASTAAKFLEHFTDYDWIHLDIAGAAFLDSKSGYKQSGATAVPVRLLYNFIKSRI